MVLTAPGLNINSHRDSCSSGLVVITEAAEAANPYCAAQRYKNEGTAEFVALHKRSVSLEVNTQCTLAHPLVGALFQK
jgi:hypothetical protein